MCLRGFPVSQPFSASPAPQPKVRFALQVSNLVASHLEARSKGPVCTLCLWVQPGEQPDVSSPLPGGQPAVCVSSPLLPGSPAQESFKHLSSLSCWGGCLHLMCGTSCVWLTCSLSESCWSCSCCQNDVLLLKAPQVLRLASSVTGGC